MPEKEKIRSLLETFPQNISTRVESNTVIRGVPNKKVSNVDESRWANAKEATITFINSPFLDRLFSGSP